MFLHTSTVHILDDFLRFGHGHDIIRSFRFIYSALYVLSSGPSRYVPLCPENSSPRHSQAVQVWWKPSIFRDEFLMRHFLLFLPRCITFCFKTCLYCTMHKCSSCLSLGMGVFICVFAESNYLLTWKHNLPLWPLGFFYLSGPEKTIALFQVLRIA